MLVLQDLCTSSLDEIIPLNQPYIQGQPTGLGALIVKRTSAHLLSSPSHTYFGGGTIDAISVSSPFWSHPRSTANSLSARYEHGTLPFLSIIALDHAMNTHYRLYGSHSNVSKHAAFVAGFARDQLSALCHANGQPLVRLHHSFHIPPGSSVLGLTPEDPGPVIGLSLFEPHGSLIGHNHVEHLTTIGGIQLRTGGMCNTGVLARVSGLDDEELKELYEGGRVCGDHGASFLLGRMCCLA
jgi:molybdenum cofactor sulfurtransferase